MRKRSPFWGVFVVLVLSTGFAHGGGWKTQRLTATRGASICPSIAGAESSVFVAWQDDTSGNDEIYFRKSTDGGASWNAAQRITDNAGASASPAIAVDGSDVYIVWADSTPGTSQVHFLRSADGGATWPAPRVLTRNKTVAAGHPAVAVVGADVYVAWHNVSGAANGNSWISFARSADRGAHWQSAKALSAPGGPAAALNPAIAAAASGVFCAWEQNEAGNNEIYFRASLNKGIVWRPSARITTNPGSSTTPALATDGSTVHLAWSDVTPGNAEVYFSQSADKGATWQPALRLTNSAGSSLTPALAVDGLDVHLAWADDTPGNAEIYHRISTNGGAGWQAAERLTRNAGASGAPALAAGGSKIFSVWRDLTPGNFEIYLALKKAVASLIAVLSPTASSAWIRGGMETIDWRVAAGAAPADRLAIDDVRIDLYAGSALAKLIASKVRAAAGTYRWEVPTGLNDGSNYKVRISSCVDEKVYGESAAFMIRRPPGPDLIISSPAASSGGGQISYSVEVGNIGSLSIGNDFYLQVELRNESGTPLRTNTYVIHGLASGGSLSVNGSFSPIPAGTYLLYTIADSTDWVAESNESNNTKSITVINN
jgi:hypothetical protein